MPFNEAFDDVYQLGIKASCEETDSYCERVDEQDFEETILERIYNQISKADLIIADMSERNANVFYEVGYAHALNKPTILLTKTSKDIPFDLTHFPHIIYDGKISKLKQDLTKKILWFKDNYKKSDIKYKFEFEIYVNTKNLAKENVVREFDWGTWPLIEFTLFNSSIHTFDPSEYQTAVITEDPYFSTHNDEVTSTQMPDGRYIHMLPSIEILFPNSFATGRINLNYVTQNIKEFPVQIRVYTEMGYRDFEFTMKEKPGQRLDKF